ncbi:RNA exonuclease 1 homolog [Toxorhynchites rutilus septentrionalis]|uniref:RNA exonuclease 1 homolog n=1 Tax=Toxorhynchites rutilus septentrionalis TaxID=329112 RepID=UPI00247AE2EB|nr:RNA exonuclease 1 homolog [Toxorhynchites rutilus septentrionalis]XP_055644760.1 RNA exonuclease 1 homolog [Toxorhynchites rutilus septentrionalis]XP_055644761.1 RNA exonuclease 1 homolog [Toxorhynchites rutilus septentrionalis]
MLPATGLFRSINCPFFEKDLCTRPFCHFRHVKPDAPAAATYNATPKSLLNQNSTVPDANSDGPAKKKPKLEYIPMPTIIAPRYVPKVKKNVEEKSLNNTETNAQIQAKDNGEQKDAEEKQIKAVEVETDKVQEESSNGGPKEDEQKQQTPEKDSTHKSIVSEVNKAEVITEKPIQCDTSTKPNTTSKTSDEVSSNSIRESSSDSVKHKKDDRDHRKVFKERKESDRRSSTSSKSSRKTSSNSQRDDKHRHRSDKERGRDRERSRSKHRESSNDKKKKVIKDENKTIADEKNKKSKETGKGEKDRRKTSEKDRDRKHKREKDRSKSSDNHRSSHSSKKSDSKSSKHSKTEHRRSSSANHTSQSSKLLSSSTSKSTQPKVELADEIYQELLDNPPSDIDNVSDEDEVMKQCKLIFEEYTVKPDKASGEKSQKPLKNKDNDVELIDIFAEKCYDESRKKRVAHEQAVASKAASVTPAAVRKPNHVQNAMRSVYARQEAVRRQQEELTAKKRLEDDAKKQIEEETRKAMQKPVTPRLSNGSARSPVLSPTQPSTSQVQDKSPAAPMNASSFYSKSSDATTATTPKGRFAPAASVLAMQRAKEKIESLKKAQASGTPAQTASRGTGRVAHTAPIASTSSAAIPTKPTPPVLEPDSSKISFNVRMQYYNIMVGHCLKIYPSCEDAWDRAQTEEITVLSKCTTPTIYKSSALLAIHKLRKEAVKIGSETSDKNKTVSHDVILAGKMGQNISWSVNKKLKTDVKSSYGIDSASSTEAYKMIYDCIMTEDQIRSNGFPRATDFPGKAKIFTPKPSRPPNENERYCSRCSKVFNLDIYEEPAVDSCNYHAKSTSYRRGFADNVHNCCQQPSGTAGCMYANYHVSHYLDYDDLTGFVKTIDPPEGFVPSKKDVFALDCEMCYTTGGLELTRITVVDINEKTVYDALVKPMNKVVDYNTRFSGITEQMLKNTTTTLHNVQAVLLSMFNSETILIGHSLDSDFKALKLIHDVIVDTSILYPHKMGPPKKRALKTLCIENLKKIIQENDAGHDSAEDSVVCIQLVKHYLRNRIL